MQGDNVQSITLYGSAMRKDYRPGRSNVNLLVVLGKIDVAILRSVLDHVVKGRRYGIAPFFITETNLRSSTDVFPVKFLAIQESYCVLWGRDILRELEISRAHLRLRCEQEVKNLLLRLRRHFLMSGGGRPQRAAPTTLTGIGRFRTSRYLHFLPRHLFEQHSLLSPHLAPFGRQEIQTAPASSHD
ncbi:MAG: hypothetical protein GY856_52645 [bacterium]|nr:hypothetical protein [bacterium]